MRIFRNLLLLGAAVALFSSPYLAGCTSSGNGEEPAPPTFDVSGAWQGSWAMGSRQGNLALTLVQADSELAGTLTITGSPCMKTANLTGTLSGAEVAFGAVGAGGNRYDYVGSISADGRTVSGQWSGTGRCAAGQSGTFVVNKT